MRVPVVIEAHGRALTVSVENRPHAVTASVGPPWSGLTLESPGPADREYQVDGSDTTSTSDRDVATLAHLVGTPLYALDAWLRDEASYSRWEDVRATDLTTGHDVDLSGPLPSDVRIEAWLRRPESAGRLWLRGISDGQREGLELDRDRRNARWRIVRDTSESSLPRWFFPEDVGPFAAEITWLVGRGAIVSVGLIGLARTLGALLRLTVGRPRPLRAGAVTSVVLPVWCVAAGLVTTWLYGQRPHILDAVAYVTQAHMFDSGTLSIALPEPLGAFKGPFEVAWNGRLFTQYPPGAPAAYALGDLVHLSWLVGPALCAALIGATAWTARTLYGAACGVAVLLLGALSPFILFQAGSFLSHPIAGGLLALALASFVRAERAATGRRWWIACGALLGAAFATRETATVLFALPPLARLVYRRERQALAWVVLAGVPFALLYAAYNAAQTGNPLLLPRALDPSDRFGFGDGIGFHTRHTPAAGLANADEMLTLLQFDVFGWPPLVAFGLIGVPFVLGRWRTWDVVAAGGCASFVLGYIGYYYHGNALGPRYYFEMLPWLLLLAGRGAQVLWTVARSRAAVGLIGAALAAHTLFFYVPNEVARRIDFSADPGEPRTRLAFVTPGLFGARVSVPSRPALVLTDSWWLYNTSLAALNCGRVTECDVIFALAPSPADAQTLMAAYPGRATWRTRTSGGRVDLVPVVAS